MSNITQIKTEEEFQTEVLESTVPVVVDFYADWCGPCKMLLPVLEDVSGHLADEVKFVKVNVDEAGMIPAEYNIRGVPTVIRFEGGKISKQKSGAMQKLEVIKFAQGVE